MHLLIDNNVPKASWDDFLINNIHQTPFQSHSFYSFYNSVKGLSAKVFAVSEESEILALCVVTFHKENGVKSFFSTRAVIYGGPLVITGDSGHRALNFMLSALNKALHSKVIYAETRNFSNYDLYKDIFLNSGWYFEPYMNVQIGLNGKTSDDLIKSMKYNRRREIQLSLKEGAVYKEAENENEVKSLYYILSKLYKSRVKLPFPDSSFFINLFNSDIGKVFIVTHNQTIIGGSFCVYYPGMSLFTMYYCGLRNYNPKIFPTHLAILAATDFGFKNNLSLIDLMGAGKPNDAYGVRDYKVQFGGNLVEDGRFVKTLNPFMYKLGKFGLKLLSKIK